MIRFFLINAFATHVLEVMHAIQQVGADWGRSRSSRVRPAILVGQGGGVPLA
jgi:hypothetical protein